MKIPYSPGQILRLKKVKTELLEMEYYFVMLGNHEDNIWLQVINTNRDFNTGFSIVPDEIENYEPIEVFGYDLIKLEVRVKENYTRDIVIGAITFVEELDSPLLFQKTNDGFESNIIFGMGDEMYPILKGKIYIEYPHFFNK